MPTISGKHAWAFPAANFSHVLSIYGGYFLDVLFRSVGFPKKLTTPRRSYTSLSLRSARNSVFSKKRSAKEQWPHTQDGKLAMVTEPLDLEQLPRETH